MAKLSKSRFLSFFKIISVIVNKMKFIYSKWSQFNGKCKLIGFKPQLFIILGTTNMKILAKLNVTVILNIVSF